MLPFLNVKDFQSPTSAKSGAAAAATTGSGSAAALPQVTGEAPAKSNEGEWSGSGVADGCGSVTD